MSERKVYRVSWEIDIEADSPQEAAQLAREINRDMFSTATVFSVQDEVTGQTWTVDLDKEDEGCKKPNG